MAFEKLNISRTSQVNSNAVREDKDKKESAKEDLDKFKNALLSDDDGDSDSSVDDEFSSTSNKDLDKFLKDKKNKSSFSGGNGFDSDPFTQKDSLKNQNSSNLSDIFSSLMTNSFDKTQNAEVVKLENNLDTDNELSKAQEIANKIVDKILVSDPKMTQGSEVRLILGQTIPELDGAQIILHRGIEGALSVVISCRNENQFKKFVDIRQNIVDALEEREKSQVKFDIIDESASSTQSDLSDIFQHI